MSVNEPVVVLVSGGINSLVAAMGTLDTHDPHLLYCDHGHRAADAELRGVRRMSEAFCAKLHVVKLPSPAEISSVQSPAGRGEPVRSPGNERSPVGRHVAGVKLAMLGVAQQLARRLNAGSIVCGASQECAEAECERGRESADPQSTHVFFHAATTAMQMGLSAKLRVELDLPLMDLCRADILRAGLRLGVPFDLSWSCHESGERPCGGCGGCKARAAAFDALGLDDPALQVSRARTAGHN